MHKPATVSSLPDNHPAIQIGKIGVLLVNLGTPDKADAPSVRRYLREFLSDKRVVDYPRAFWLPVLHGIILNTRPGKTAKLYQSIWMKDQDESPLRYYTRRQSELVSAGFDDPVVVDWAMRYGHPSIESRLKHLQSNGCDRILIVPLYPQYAGSTTATVVDEVARVMKTLAWQPSIRIAPPFYDEADYIGALAQTIDPIVSSDIEQVIISFHGIPERYFKAGDPYHCHCHKTARLIRERMKWGTDYSPTGFQSKFGPEKWLEPSTESLVEKAAAEGKKKIAVMAPAFVSDCIETLEEISLGLNETFQEAGGEELVAIPCLNDHAAFVSFLKTMIKRELGGWI